MFEEIKKLFVEFANVNENQVTLEANLKKDLGIDSIYAVELTLQLEEVFGVEIEWEEMQALQTVKDIVDLIEGKVKKNA